MNSNNDHSPFANRLRKNFAHWRRWARREGTDCYRVYDRDLPDFAVALDVYGDALLVQEYQAPAHIDPARVTQRRQHVLDCAPGILQVARDRVFLKLRQRQRGKDQYIATGQGGREFVVHEGRAKLHVNLSDYLDSGLFLDHRPIRGWLAEQACGRRFLNLFCYTASATVHAALGGARQSTSVDMSATYLAWARRNFETNGMNLGSHELLQADCLSWLQTARGGFDLIFIDPPSFSNSKRMAATLDVQRDHVQLIRRAAALLASDGMVVFSTNLRSFRLDGLALRDLAPQDITPRTIPRDFARHPRVHQCFLLRR